MYQFVIYTVCMCLDLDSHFGDDLHHQNGGQDGLADVDLSSKRQRLHILNACEDMRPSRSTGTS